MNVDIKHISGGTQIIGDNGTVHQYGSPADETAAAVAALVQVVARYRAELAAPEQVHAAALAVRDEVVLPRPRKERVMALLRELAAAAGNVSAVVGAAQGVAEIARNLP
jgi:hypothetical protein